MIFVLGDIVKSVNIFLKVCLYCYHVGINTVYNVTISCHYLSGAVHDLALA